MVLEKLTPLTEYLVNVYSVAGELSSEPLKGTETTCESSSFPSSPLATAFGRRPDATVALRGEKFLHTSMCDTCLLSDLVQFNNPNMAP